MSKTEQRRASEEAAFDVLLERATGAPSPDVAAAVVRAHRAGPLAPGAGSRVRHRGWIAALLMLGVGVVGTLLWLERGGGARGTPTARPSSEQDPPARDVLRPRSPEELRALLADPEAIEGVSAQAGHVVLMEFPIGNVRGRQVRYVEIPEVVMPLDNGLELAAAFAELVKGPSDASGGYPDDLFDLQIDLSGMRRIVVRCYIHHSEGTHGCGIGGLGFFNLDGELRDAILDVHHRVERAADGVFAAVSNAEELRAVPQSVQHLVCYGVGDADLAPLAELTELRRLRLIGRRLDEYPQDYAGVGLGTAGIATLEGLGHLRELVLLGAAIDDDALATLAALPALDQLVLGENERSSFTPGALAAFCDRSPVRILTLGRAPHLDNAHLEALGAAPNLEQLNLDLEKGGADAGLASVLDSTSLRRVSIDVGERPLDLRMVFAGDEGIRASVETLSLNGRDYRLGLLGVERRSALRELDIGGAELLVNSLAAVGGSRLESLTLRRCTQLPDAGLEQLGRAAGLRQISIRSNAEDIAWAGAIESWKGLRRLRSLRLNQCRPDPLDLRALREFDRLETLDLAYCDLGEEFLGELRRALPETEVLGSGECAVGSASVATGSISRGSGASGVWCADAAGAVRCLDRVVGVCGGYPCAAPQCGPRHGR